MGFMQAVKILMNIHGFDRRAAVCIVRLQRGIDSTPLEQVDHLGRPLLTMSEYVSSQQIYF